MNQNQNTSKNIQDTFQHSKPIPISTQHLRHRSASFSSDSSGSPVSPPPLVTPNNFSNTRIPPTSSSPILYILSQSPSKPSAAFPFRGFPPPLIEDEQGEDIKPPAHARRGSTASRFPPQFTAPETHHERGVNVLRRLSLGGPLGKSSSVGDIPQPGSPPPPPNLTAPNGMNTSRKFRRSATITGQTRPRRAPSPMGERILKGHFDGFN